MKPPPCPYCGAEPVLREAEEIYGKPYGRVWVCANWPECDAIVGCHMHSSVPLGTLANKELRRLRNEAHRVFDGYWRRHGKSKRDRAYKELMFLMHVRPKECHIGLFDIEQCRRVIELYSNRE